MADKKTYRKITDFEYAERFEVNSKNKRKQKAALERAWKNRDFEIDKFWSRSAYFWGFIVLIFGAYISVTIGENTSKTEEMYFDLYLILLGIIFSTAWLLVIKGNKKWQENWEKHIDKLEDDITGPIHKTVYCTKRTVFSVSKINGILAVVVIILWGLLLLRYIGKNIKLFKMFSDWIAAIPEELVFIVLPIIGTMIAVFIILRKYGQSSDGKYNLGLKGEESVFVDRANYNETSERK